ncbi:hypothetical protein DES53_104294 [Roseimicrobium gellanilyticum]|uniref:Uncharacterized protein n=1 Tax=Roseimicrobium gellanilyticum TaxID=748857 RepID=A0A366HN82_9BACT|nr:hypothetical protein [Roseimicrobium gellanilyticum]RBP44473.1 hypothetical protein DES53_104294 [Roseimicrobium gellanilyticum]
MKPLSEADKALILEIQECFPVEAYRGGIPKKVDANIGPLRSKLCRFALSSTRGLLGDVLIDILVGNEQFDDFMVLYYLEVGEKPTAKREEAIREFACLTKRQRRVVADWLHHVSSFALASDQEAYDRAARFWDGFAEER